jgi:hypothetical protein
MSTTMARLLTVLFVLTLFSASAVSDETAPTISNETAPAISNETAPPIEDIGNGHYRIGSIEIDKNAQKFTVPGTTIALDKNMPIEFLAIAKGGYKSYEALVELDVSAVEFNLACILIGLDSARASHPEYHFDKRRVTGDIVDVRVSWMRDGVEQTYEIERLIQGMTEPGDHAWVYTGSLFTPDGTYMATMVGTLIGVVHDPESIIQHQNGMGIGEYGAIVYDPDVMPVAGTQVTVSVLRNPE